MIQSLVNRLSNTNNNSSNSNKNVQLNKKQLESLLSNTTSKKAASRESSSSSTSSGSSSPHLNKNFNLRDKASSSYQALTCNYQPKESESLINTYCSSAIESMNHFNQFIDKFKINQSENENATSESLYNGSKNTTYRKKEEKFETSESSSLLIEKEVTKITPKGRFCDEPHYRMDHSKRGTAIIINNKIFDARLEMPVRDGTDKDASSIEAALRNLDFDVKIVQNCTAISMRTIMNNIAKMDHSNADCLVCVVMSHGENGIVYGVDGEIELDQLIKPFKYNKTLAGKPKLFFIQACRGTNLMEGVDSNPFEVSYVSKIPMEADFLIAYSTIAGYYSWRNSVNGSWFIQSLCAILNEYGTELELMQLLTAVNRRVAYYYQSNASDPEMSGKKQIPCIVSMLTKELYFKPKNKSTSTVTINYS